jgi:cysteinyl-tRNA synthetase
VSGSGPLAPRPARRGGMAGGGRSSVSSWTKAAGRDAGAASQRVRLLPCRRSRREEHPMALKLYNTLTRRLEPFEPLVPGEVRMYTCGVTVYDLCHIGHARSALVFDVIRRYFEYSGYRVMLVRNFTDVDDKIIDRARELGIAWDALARRYIEAFHQDMAALGLREADIEPKATDHIPEMIQIIQVLERRGLAYAVEGDVYYAIRRFPEYGKLSHRSLEDLRAGARIEVDERKRDPLDFALWKASRPGEPAWDSPWGPGRPGWHIECSAMASKYLGASFDVHAGGEDLIFPHHENEIAQSEGATGKPLARYWLHNGFVTVAGEKMAKSLGNFVTIRDALDRFSPEALKLLLLSTNYRGPMDYAEAAVLEKAKALASIQDFRRGVDRLGVEMPQAGSGGGPAPGTSREGLHPAEVAFRMAMDDDFNTARATGVLFDLVRDGNRLLHETTRAAAAGSRIVFELRETAGLLRRLGAVLGLDFRGGGPLVSTFRSVRRERTAAVALEELEALVQCEPRRPVDLEPRLTSVVQELLAHREAARKARDWATADAIRDALVAHGLRLEDTKTATHAVSGFAEVRKLPAIAVTLVTE